MKILIVYGGVNKGLKKEIIEQGLHRNQNGSKLSCLKNLDDKNQYFINSVTNIINSQQVAAVDSIDIVYRHMTDLQDYLYMAEETVVDKSAQQDVK